MILGLSVLQRTDSQTRLGGWLYRPRCLFVTMLVVACAACGDATAPTAPAGALATPSSTAVGAVPSATSTSQPTRVAVIVMENHGFDQVVGLPYIHTLATTTATLTDYHASSHPSLPNYLALTSGITWGIADDGYHVLPTQDVGDQMTAAGIPWRAYMEGMGADCLVSGGGYAVKHNPFAYYGGRCPSSVVPLSNLRADLNTPVPPRLLWITPNLCNDMHDCSAAVGDAWLRTMVPSITGAPAMSNGVLFITWDENDGGSNRVLTLVLGSKRPVSPAHAYSHPSLLTSVEDLLGLPRLPATAGVAAIAVQ